MVISDRRGAYALKRAQENNIKTYIVDRKEQGKNYPLKY